MNRKLGSRKPLASICIPTLNEAGNIEALHIRLTNLAQSMKNQCDFEFIFSDNHSDDNTWELLEAIAKNDSRVKVIRFSRNFGFQRSIFANYLHAKGEIVMQIDADLQDPPEMFVDFFQKWHEGFDVIYGVRVTRPENWFLSRSRKLGYWAIDKLSTDAMPKNAGDFRLIDRKVVDALLKNKSPDPYIRGIIATLGFNQIGIPYSRSSRSAGKSKFNFSRLIRLGVTAVFHHSTLPLRFATYLGSTILFSTILGSAYYVFLRISNPHLPQGMASLHIIVLFGIGIVSFLLGIIGEYLLRIYKILVSEPIAVVEKSLNFTPSDLKL